jgi:hypothetical protein
MKLKIVLFIFALILVLTAQPALPVKAAYCDAAQFVADVTVPDGTVLAPGTVFNKTWRIKNVGTCTWSTAYSAVFDSGERMGAATAVNLPNTVAPGQTVDITVQMTAPASSGTYRGYWKLRNASNVLFGLGTSANKPFWVEIKVSSTTGVAFDFVANAPSATWTSGAGVLPFSGTEGDSKGFVRKLDAPKLENGVVDNQPGLLTVPQSIQNGYIQGVFPAFTVQAGDRFQSIVNCEYGATGCYVTFRLDYQIGSNPVRTFWTFDEKYEGKYYRVDKDLSPLAGYNVKFILTVLAAGSPTGDRAVWGAPRILRGGGGGVTAIPTTPSSGSSCDRATFIADITVPDGTIFAPNQDFTKTWRLKNSGTCAWTTSYALVFVSGDQMGGPTSANLPITVGPGQMVDLTVGFKAPSTAGNYKGYWQFRNANGVPFGIGPSGTSPFWVSINVGGGGSGPASGYDFAANACNAQWYSGAGALPCPGTEGDNRGFVLKLGNAVLENGTPSGQPGLLTHPQNIDQGYIQGVYPAYSVKNGDRFQSIVNCASDAANCYVTFRLDYKISGSSAVKTFWSFNEKYEGRYYAANVDLSPLAGQNVQFILTVLAYGSPQGDRATWVAPRIAGLSSGPTPTVAPPTPTTIPPTSTGIPPTSTAISPTSTGVPPTSTAIPPTPTHTNLPPTPTSETSAWMSYQNPLYKFTFKIPPGAVFVSMSNTQARINLPFAANTNLTEKYLEAKVTEGLTPCKESDGMASNSQNVTINSIEFLKETGQEGAAGSIYDWTSYSVSRENACITVKFVLRSANLGNFSTPPPAFDPIAESAIFAQIMNTFAWLP